MSELRAAQLKVVSDWWERGHESGRLDNNELLDVLAAISSKDDRPAFPERGPEPLDVERLALSLHDLEWNCPADCGDDEAAAAKLHERDARAIATTYADNAAALSKETPA